jgi:hypothetical protein
MDVNQTKGRPIPVLGQDSDASVRSMADVLDEFWTQYRARFPELEVSAADETMAVAVV